MFRSLMSGPYPHFNAARNLHHGSRSAIPLYPENCPPSTRRSMAGLVRQFRQSRPVRLIAAAAALVAPAMPPEQIDAALDKPATVIPTPCAVAVGRRLAAPARQGAAADVVAEVMRVGGRDGPF